MKKGLLIFAALAVGLAGAIGWFYQRQAGLELRSAIERERAAEVELPRLRAEQGRLTATRTTESELEAMRADHGAVVRLRHEVEALNGRMTETSPANLVPARNWVTAMVPASEWKNVGRATPLDAMETGLWAAAGGDLEVLSSLLTLNPAGRTFLEDWYAQLPEAIRASYGSPFRLLALLVAKNTPLEGAQLRTQIPLNPNTVALQVRLRQPGGSAREISLDLKRADDGWKWNVPESLLKELTAKASEAGAP